MPIDVHGGWHVAAVVLTQLWVMLAWVFFRCDSAAQHRGPCRNSRPEGLTRARGYSWSRAASLPSSGSITRLGALASGCRYRPDGPGRSRGAGSERCLPSGSRRCRSCRNRSPTSSSEAVHPPPPARSRWQRRPALLDVGGRETRQDRHAFRILRNRPRDRSSSACPHAFIRDPNGGPMAPGASSTTIQRPPSTPLQADSLTASCLPAIAKRASRRAG